MKTPYKRLNRIHRIEIEKLIALGKNNKQIASALSVHPSTISKVFHDQHRLFCHLYFKEKVCKIRFIKILSTLLLITVYNDLTNYFSVIVF